MDWALLIAAFVIGGIAAILGRRLLPLHDNEKSRWWFTVSIGRQRHKQTSAGEPGRRKEKP